MSKHVFKLDPWHFVIAIAIFYILTTVVAEVKVKQMPLASVNTNLIELEEIELNNEELYFVFFHDSNSELCEKVRFNIEKLIESNQEPLSFYAIDVSKNPGSFYEYNVSGVPNILVFKGNKEIKRIMGVISYENLTSIVQRMRKYA
ncbi:thioredoxin family protein [Proteiniphilum acetatigenes]|uniref:thioredoxin family protein n=1 Tax=Proteiniphilum acetatigenes TaxID=294710 RepID=UPI00036F1508|nr:thioredoxin family protein [Proteiniphilum acetatigenes]SFK82737.1 Thioredoxin [Porphyromonadaceae bacterium KH3CP3RA]